MTKKTPSELTLRIRSQRAVWSIDEKLQRNNETLEKAKNRWTEKNNALAREWTEAKATLDAFNEPTPSNGEPGTE